MKKILIAGAAIFLSILCAGFACSGITKFSFNSISNPAFPAAKIVGNVGNEKIPQIPQADQKITDVISYRLKKIGGATLKISINAQNISTKLLGTGFDFVFPSEFLNFITYETGNFFERGGSPLYAAKLSRNGSAIVAGITLKRGDTLQNGSGTIVSFYFKIKKEDKYNFSFKNTVAATIQNGLRKNVYNVNWWVLESSD